MIVFDDVVERCELISYACPTVYAGVLRDGRHFCFRYRAGTAALGLGTSLKAAAAKPRKHPRLVLGDENDAFLSDTQFRATFLALLEVSP